VWGIAARVDGLQKGIPSARLAYYASIEMGRRG
jgi:hypothetical protein